MVCDLSNAHTDAARTALEVADLVVVVAPCDIRSCAATAARVPALDALNPNVGLVVRGPAPGGLGSAEFAGVVGLPCWPRDAPRTDAGQRLRTRRTAARRPVSAGPRRAAGSRRAGRRTFRGQRSGRVNAPLIDRVRERLAAESGPLRPNTVARAIRAESGGVLGDSDVLANLRMLQTDDRGRHPEPAAPGPQMSWLPVRQVWIDDSFRPAAGRYRFPDEAAVRRLAQRLALAAGRRLDDAAPWVDGLLTEVSPPTARSGCMPCCRRFPLGNGDFVAGPPSCQPGSGHAVRNQRRRPRDRRRAAGRPAARLAFLVSGGTGAGKTTLLAALLGAVSGDERIVCVEDAANSRPPTHVRGESRCPRTEYQGAGEITVRQLVRQALRMRPDRIVVGEVRGAGVVDLLSALNTRTRRWEAGTVHANSSAEVPARLEALGVLGEAGSGGLACPVSGSGAVLLHVSRDQDGRQRLSGERLLDRRAYHLPKLAWHADRVQGGTGRLTELLETALSMTAEQPWLHAVGGSPARDADPPTVAAVPGRTEPSRALAPSWRRRWTSSRC